jgi:hypothetical protein
MLALEQFLEQADHVITSACCNWDLDSQIVDFLGPYPPFHTAEVTGSSPVPPTLQSASETRIQEVSRIDVPALARRQVR